jgi:hypothetical protein
MRYKTIQKELEEFERESIEIVPGFYFNQKSTINRIYFYYNSKFETGEYDNQGDKKYFYNIVRNPCNVATKAVDFDTKDVRILTSPGGDPETTWYFERDLRFWMKDNGFGKVLNRIFYELPIFGTVVLKIIDNKPYFVDLRNFIVDQCADSLDKANYIIEIHNYTPVEFRKEAKKMGWKNWKEVLDKYREIQEKEPYIRICERYGELEDEDGEWRYKKLIIADIGEGEVKGKYTGEYVGEEYILEEKEVETHPYKEFHWEKIPGRWLGVGRVEVLFDNQMRVNEISNQQVKSSYYSTLRIFQTRDVGVSRNLLTDVENGEILTVEDDIRQVDMADRNLSYYDQEIGRWIKNRDEITFAYDVLRGESLPSGTPLGSAQLAAGMAGSYFDQIRENIAMDIKDLFFDVIIPGFLKENTKEHILRIAGEDLDKINNLMLNLRLKEEIIDFVNRNASYPSPKEIELLRGIVSEQVKKEKEKMITIPKDFYKDIKYKIDIDITSESVDVRIRASNMWVALQAITADPTLLTDPIKKKIFQKYLEQGGISLLDIESQVEQPSLEKAVSSVVEDRAGGGISRPVIPQIPIMGQETAKI